MKILTHSNLFKSIQNKILSTHYYQIFVQLEFSYNSLKCIDILFHPELNRNFVILFEEQFSSFSNNKLSYWHHLIQMESLNSNYSCLITKELGWYHSSGFEGMNIFNLWLSKANTAEQLNNSFYFKPKMKSTYYFVIEI